MANQALVVDAGGRSHHLVDGLSQGAEQSEALAACLAMKPAPYLSEKRAAVVIWISAAVFTLGAMIFGH